MTNENVTLRYINKTVIENMSVISSLVFSSFLVAVSKFYIIQLHNDTTLQISKQIQIFFGCITNNLLLSQTLAQFFLSNSY